MNVKFQGKLEEFDTWWQAAIAVVLAVIFVLALFAGASWVVMALVNYLVPIIHISIYKAAAALILAEIFGHVLFKKRIVFPDEE